MSGVLALLAAYLLGSLPFGWLLYRLRTGGDIRRQGSGNIGATNVLRVFGAPLGLATLLLDAGKGAGAAWLGRWLGGEPLAAACVLAAVVGHVFPVFLGFRGGKGVATLFGGFAVLAPWPTACAAAVFLTVALLTRYGSVASLAGSLSLLLAVLLRLGGVTALVAALAVALVLWRHRENIARLSRGQEPRLGSGGQRAGA